MKERCLKCGCFKSKTKVHICSSGGFKKGHIQYNKNIEKYYFKKGSIPWIKGKKINIIEHPNYGMKGKRHSKESILKMSLSHQGQVAWNKGIKGIHIAPNNEWKKGHIPWNKGKPFPQMIGNKYTVGKPSPMKGKHHSEESKLKISQNKERARKISNALKGNTNVRGHHLTDEHKRKISEANKISRLYQIFPRKDTLPERIIQIELKNRNISYETHKPIVGQPDILIGKICIFADGCYWHGCEKCLKKKEFDHIQKKIMARDKLVTQTLIDNGYVVLRFWEHDIKKNINFVIKTVEDVLNVRKNDKI